jgi:hypothetical protein
MEVISYKITKEDKDSLSLESFIPWRKKGFLVFALAASIYVCLQTFISSDKELMFIFYMILIPLFISIYLLLEKKTIFFDKSLQKITMKRQYLFFRKINILNYSEINSIRLEYESGVSDLGAWNFNQTYLISGDNKKISLGVYDSSAEAWYIARKVNLVTGKILDNKGHIDKAELMNKIFFVTMCIIFVIGTYTAREFILLFLLLFLPIAFYIIRKFYKK